MQVFVHAAPSVELIVDRDDRLRVEAFLEHRMEELFADFLHSSDVTNAALGHFFEKFFARAPFGEDFADPLERLRRVTEQLDERFVDFLRRREFEFAQFQVRLQHADEVVADRFEFLRQAHLFASGNRDVDRKGARRQARNEVDRFVLAVVERLFERERLFDEAFVFEVFRLQRRQVAGERLAVAEHPLDFKARTLDADDRVVVHEGVEPGRRSAFFRFRFVVRNDPRQKRRRDADERKENDRVRNVEEGVRQRDLRVDVQIPTFAERVYRRKQNRVENRQRPANADTVEERVEVRDPPGVRRRADRRQERRDRRADIFAQHERGRRREVDRAERRQRHREPDRRRRRLNEHRRNAADHNAFERAPKIRRFERLHKLRERRDVRKRSQRGAHRLQAEENQPDSERAGREVANLLVFRQKINETGDADERQTVRAEVQRQKPTGRRRPDVRPHHAPDRLRERHQAAVDEAENHHRRRGTRLNENRRHKADADREETVVREHRNDAAKARAGDRLQTVRHPLHPDEEEAETAQHRREDAPIIRRPTLRFERNDGDFRRIVFRRRLHHNLRVAERFFAEFFLRPVDVERRSFEARFRDRAAVFFEFERQIFRFRGAVRLKNVLFAKSGERRGEVERRRRGADENLQVGEPFLLNDIFMLGGSVRGVGRFGRNGVGRGFDGGGFRRRRGVLIVGANGERRRRGRSEERQEREKRDERGGFQSRARSLMLTFGNAHFGISPKLDGAPLPKTTAPRRALRPRNARNQTERRRRKRGAK